MMPVEELDFSSSDEIVIEPDLRQDEDDDLGAVGPTPPPSLPVIKHQEDVQVQAIPLFKDEKAVAALKTLREQGYTAEEILEAYQHVPMPTTRVKERQAKRSSLDDLIRHHAGRILKERGMNMEGRELDKARLDRSNWLVLKARIDTLIKERVANKDRADYVREELDRAHNLLDGIIAEVEAEFFDG